MIKQQSRQPSSKNGQVFQYKEKEKLFLHKSGDKKSKSKTKKKAPTVPKTIQSSQYIYAEQDAMFKKQDITNIRKAGDLHLQSPQKSEIQFEEIKVTDTDTESPYQPHLNMDKIHRIKAQGQVNLINEVEELDLSEASPGGFVVSSGIQSEML